MDSGHGEEPRGSAEYAHPKELATHEMGFTSPSPPAKREAAPKTLQCGEDPGGL